MHSSKRFRLNSQIYLENQTNMSRRSGTGQQRGIQGTSAIHKNAKGIKLFIEC